MKKYKNAVVFLILVAFTMMITLAVAYESPDNRAVLDNDYVAEFLDGWETPEGVVKLPYEFTDYDNNTVIIKNVIPKDIGYQYGLLVYTTHQSVKVYVGYELIYEYESADSRLSPSEGSGWHLIDLSKMYAGKTVTIEYTSVLDKYAGEVGEIYIGDRTALIVHIISKNLFAFCSCIMLFALAALFLLMWLGVGKQFNNSSILYLALCAFQVGIWSIFETDFYQLFFGNLRARSIFLYEAIMIIPYPTVAFFASLESRPVTKKAASILARMQVMIFAVSNLLHITGIVDLAYSLVATHIAFLIDSVVIVTATVVDRKKQTVKNSQNISGVGFVIFAVFLIFDLFRYYNENASDSALFSRMGLFIFILSLGIDTLGESVRMMLLGRKAEVYEGLAYHDALTGVFSRTAYVEKLEEYKQKKTERVQILAIDLNSLKQVNDTLGHAEGDRYIKDSAAFITEHFNDIGQCYRIGGDEFMVLSECETAVFMERIKVMAEYMENADKVNFAYGYFEYDSRKDMSLEDAVKRADSILYECKKKMKKK